MSKLIAAASTERWKAGLGLAGLGGLRLGEVRGLQWGDIDLAGNTISVRRSLLPDGTAKATKTEAGERTVPLFPELRRLLVAWKVKSPFTDPEDYVLFTASRGPVQQRNAQRALEKAKVAAGLDSLEGRLSWHSLRHSAGSIWLTEYGIPVTTVSAMMGHANPSFTLACYGRDPRDEQTMVADVLARAAAAGGECLRWWASELRLSARPLRRSRAGLVSPRAAPRSIAIGVILLLLVQPRPLLRRRRQGALPVSRSWHQDLRTGRFREGGRDGDRPRGDRRCR